MDVESSPLLKTLIEYPADEVSEAHFVAALARLGIQSIFDIVRMSRDEFVAQLQKELGEGDAGQAYDNAMGYAAQLDMIHREQRMSSPDVPARKARGATDNKNTDAPDQPTYPLLFKEDWGTFCSDTSMAANDSPVAYLRALYLFAIQLEKGATSTANTLQQRRPDLHHLIINTRTTFNQVPMLSIVIKTLEEHIRATQQADIYQLLNSQAYPYRFPYNFYHHQCRQRLLDNNIQLGELNYKVCQRLSPFDNPRYSPVRLKLSATAQRLLSGLSPEQQNLLLTPLTDVSDEGVQQFYETHYNHTAALSGQGNRSKTQDLLTHLSKAEVFLDRTQLDAGGLQSLLAQKSFAPHRSAAVPGNMVSGHGSVYVNGPDLSLAPMTLVSDKPSVADGSQRLSNTSVDRFDRLHRMIRLQRWLDIPFAELDILIVSAMRCEKNAQQTPEEGVADAENTESISDAGNTPLHPPIDGGRLGSGNNESLQLNGNTLRALGVYRYFKRIHGLPAEEFAALLFEMPVHASGPSLSLYDRVFNPPQSLGQVLTLDGKGLSSTTRQRLCTALGLSNTQDSLQLLIRTIPKEERRRTLQAISSIYRQARIARLFGLSVLECRQLLELLGPTHLQQYIAPCLRSSATQGVDFLDVLMHLDWAVRWRQSNGVSVAKLRRQMVRTSLDEFSSFRQLRDQLPELSSSLEQNRLLSVDSSRQLHAVTQDQLHVQTHALMPGLRQKYLGALMGPIPAPLVITPVFIRHLLMLMPNAERLLQLPVSNDALLAFMLNPHWLDNEYPADSLLDLTFNTVYLLQRVQYCVDTFGRQEEALLEYFSRIHDASPPSAFSTKQANAWLAALLGWAQKEVEILVDSLATHAVTSVSQLDWLMRCKQVCLATGLTADILLKAGNLGTTSPPADWKVVGEALTSNPA
jgi:hypothetical protein